MTNEHGMQNGNYVPWPNFGDEIIHIQTDTDKWNINEKNLSDYLEINILVI